MLQKISAKEILEKKKKKMVKSDGKKKEKDETIHLKLSLEAL